MSGMTSLVRYYGYSKEEYSSCEKRIQEYNEATAKKVSVAIVIMSIAWVTTSLALSKPITDVAISLASVVASVTVCILSSKGNGETGRTHLIISILIGFSILAYVISGGRYSEIYYALIILTQTAFIGDQVIIGVINAVGVIAFIAGAYIVEDDANIATTAMNLILYVNVIALIQFSICRRILGIMISSFRRNKALDSYRVVQEDLHDKIKRDPMTGLYNRAAFMELAERRIIKCKETGMRPALCIMDLDKFKSINDTYGHQMGDKVIMCVADVLKRAMRGGDIVARLGGDEYIFLLADIVSREAVESVLTRILKKITELGEGLELPLGASIGVVRVSDKKERISEWYRKADEALYTAKTDGRSKFKIYAE